MCTEETPVSEERKGSACSGMSKGVPWVSLNVGQKHTKCMNDAIIPVQTQRSAHIMMQEGNCT